MKYIVRLWDGVLTQRAFATEELRALHEQGWTDSLDRLQELMSQAGSGER